ncbi:MAG TPA: formyltetrahydrofolate deformylase [Streptosporangiaceae bacterium]|nr:formyltetrahydrofolate deformylase [Streptosporangiaceae bacterium]
MASATVVIVRTHVASPGRLRSQRAERSFDDRYRDIGRLLITCPDRPGIVAAVSRFLYESGANILESQQYSTDPFGGTFFVRIEFHRDGLTEHFDEMRTAFGELSDAFSMRWKMTRAGELKRMAIFVSKADHVLQELLWRVHSDELNTDIKMVISNHRDLEDSVTSWGIPFHHVPVTKDNKSAAEEAQLKLIAGEVDLVVLARYMQILSPGFLTEFTDPIINIHHSFLPAFKGANPYRAAHERGVKLIGATAHYVTAELDAGPIIEQDIVRVDHRQSVEDLRRMGRHVERAVLARAVAWHLDDRVIVHQNKTIVFA